jgi:hypothetical protein
MAVDNIAEGFDELEASVVFVNLTRRERPEHVRSHFDATHDAVLAVNAAVAHDVTDPGCKAFSH